mmetsp:Transcript_7171/g.13624  ORF Transcript_7171/g.13624 Transcript_7171/m.13624 type:complete len:149 (+) Transcript_7171:1942-2388(+)
MKPKLPWKKMFCEEIAGHVADVFPISLGKAILILTSLWCSSDVCASKVEIIAVFECVGTKECFDVITDYLEITVREHFGRITPKILDELLHGCYHVSVLQRFETVYELHSCSSVDEEEDVCVPPYRHARAIANVVVDDGSISVGARDG